MDIGYFAPGTTIVKVGESSDFLHVLIKGAVEERNAESPGFARPERHFRLGRRCARLGKRKLRRHRGDTLLSAAKRDDP